MALEESMSSKGAVLRLSRESGGHAHPSNTAPLKYTDCRSEIIMHNLCMLMHYMKLRLFEEQDFLDILNLLEDRGGRSAAVSTLILSLFTSVLQDLCE